MFFKESIMNIKDMVSHGKKVNFIKFQNKELWYVTECGFEFPIPLSDTDGAIFNSQDKALFCMRWIKKHIENINSAKNEQISF
jgi:hypothetical protein